MTPFRRSFLVWALVVGSVCVLLNLPDNRGMKGGVAWAGFPWDFYDGWRSEFDPLALVGDVFVGALVTVGVAAVCAWSRTRRPAGPTPSPPP